MDLTSRIFTPPRRRSDATAFFKVQPTEMTDLRGTRHVALSRFLARYFKYTRETLNAPLENNEFIVR